MRPIAFRRTLGVKLALAFTGVLAVMLGSLAVVLVESGRAEDAYRAALHWRGAVDGAARQAAGTRQQQAAQALYVATFDPRYKSQWEAGVAISDKAGDAVEALHDPTVARIAAGATAADHKHDDTVHKLLFPAVARGDRSAALAALAQADRYVRVPLAAQEKIGAYVDRRQAQDIARAESASATARHAGLLAGLLATLLAAAIVFLVSRGIRRSAGDVLDRLRVMEERDATELRAALDAVAGGDLTRPVTAETPAIERPGTDEIGDIARATNGIRERLHGSMSAYNAMREKLAGMIGEVAGSSQQVAQTSQSVAATSQEAGTAAGEIAHAVGEVAQGAERQARSVETVREAAAEAAAAARASAQRAQDAAQAAEEARGVALEGTGAAADAQAAMEAVRDSSREVTVAIRDLAERSGQIVSIVETISGIADQTNMLALNAAIEAARAGEQGRGFAVVAEQVRELAEGSQRAAGSIADLVTGIKVETERVVTVVEAGAERTEAGAATVQQAREAFLRIERAVDDVSARIEDIAGAAEQISAGTARIQQDVGEVAAVAEESSASAEEVSASTQQTSASSQQIAASAQELTETAQRLDSLVGAFRL
jgi:methyl-accepting chemotaxis protein